MKKLLVCTDVVLAEQRDLFGEFIYLHQIFFEKIVNSCVILLSCLVLWQIAEPVAVIEIQSMQTSDFTDFVAPCSEPVLFRSVGLRLERLKVNVVTVFNESLGYSFLGIFLTESVQSEGAFIVLSLNCPILPFGIGTEGVSHFREVVFKLPKIVAHCNGFIQSGTSEIIACGHSGFILLGQILCIRITLRFFDCADTVLFADAVSFLIELKPRGIPATLPIDKGNRVDDKVAVQMLRIQMGRHQHLIFLAPNGICELHSDMLGKLRCDVSLLKAEITVVGLNAVRLVELLLDSDKLLTSNSRSAVDPLTE